jgi:hypothetical protein
MSLAVFVARFFSVSLLAVGVSHLIQPRLWRDFFILIKRTGVAGIIIAMYTLPQGLLIILSHNVWVWDVPVIITISGWGMTIKSLLYAFVPRMAERAIPEEESAYRKYAIGGALIIPVSLLLVYHSFFRAG